MNGIFKLVASAWREYREQEKEIKKLSLAMDLAGIKPLSEKEVTALLPKMRWTFLNGERVMIGWDE